MKKLAQIIFIAPFIIFSLFLLWQFFKKEVPLVMVTNFKECAKTSKFVMENYPRRCIYEGKTFTEDIRNKLEKTDIIRVENPSPNQIIKSPLIIKGKARGSWFFEGDFPVMLTDWDGLIISQGIATAKGDWMSKNFVPFTAVLEFETPVYKNNGSLILKKDNPSGLSEYDDAIEIPIYFEDAIFLNGKENESILPFNSGVSGKVLLSPICPVLKYPPEPSCSAKAYQATVQVIKISSPKSSPFATAKTDKDGQYELMLPPGEYSLQAVSADILDKRGRDIKELPSLPRCETKNIIVKPEETLKVNLICDTGIR